MADNGMKIICNGEQKNIEPGTSVEQFIQNLKINPDTVVAECDGKILKREEYAGHILMDRAELELIRFVGGG